MRAGSTLAQHRLERAPDDVRHAALALRGGMNPVALVQALHSCNTLQQKRDERGAVLLRHGAEDVAEGGGVARAKVGRRLHADDDERGRGILRCSAIQDGVEVAAQCGGVDAAEPVVGSRLDDEHIHRPLQQPVDSLARARGRFPAHTGVHHRKREPGIVDPLLDQGRVRLRRIESEAGGEARAEEDDAAAVVRDGCRGLTGWSRFLLTGTGEAQNEERARSPPAYHSGRARRGPATLSGHYMLRCDQLTKTYVSGGRDLTVLKDITFHLEPGGFLAIIGPSGSGKTTLLGLLAGLDRPTAGTVRLDGTDLGSLDEDDRARLRRDRVGFVFQSFQLVPTLTALENVQVPLELAGNGRRNAGGESIERRALDLLGRVGLAGRAHHYPAQLSGGEQQRVALARAFSNRPKILFADEPTGNLDARTGHLIVELMGELNRDLGTTLVLVTHDPDLASRAARTIRLADGAIVSDSASPDPVSG